MSTLPIHLGAPMAPPRDCDGQADASQRIRTIARRKLWWILLLTIGFWFARPYYIPWTAEEEANADTRATAAQGSVERQVAMPLLAALGCYMLWRTKMKPKFKGALATAAAAYCVWNGVSIAWSVEPATTLKRLIVFYFCIVLLVALAKTFDVMDLARLGYYSCGLIALIAIFCDVFVTKTFSPYDPDYRFLGVMSSNSEGQNITACIFCGLAIMMNYPRWRKWILPSLFLGGALLYFTRGRTATIACVVLSLIFAKRIVDSTYRLQTRILIGILGLAFVVPAIMLSVDHAGDILESTFMMGRDDVQNTASLSNRAPLWDELRDYVEKRPLLGYGYNTFWTSDTISLISKHQKWGVPNAHNTVLDQELSAGVVAAALFTLVLWGSLFRSWACFKRNPRAETLLPPIMISWLVFTTFAESVPIEPFLPTFLAYVFVAQTLMPEGAALPEAHESAMLEQELVTA